MAKKDSTSEKAPSQKFIGCTIKQLPEQDWLEAATTAIAENPVNSPPAPVSPARMAVETTKYWGKGGIDLAVAFMEPCPTDLRDRILAHANAWSKTANIKYRWTATVASAQVRITREDDGYWSYLGTDILHIPVNQATMCFQGFTMKTPESEYLRVVPHEFGHTNGFPHEQFLPEFVALLDPEKVIPWAMRYTGWTRQEVIDQMLTPLPAGSYRMSAHADINGVMAYSFPASVTRDGKPIPGGVGIDQIDAAFAAEIYPLVVQPPPSGSAIKLTLTQDLKAGTYLITPDK
jgi:hypothetical protein